MTSTLGAYVCDWGQEPEILNLIWQMDWESIKDLGIETVGLRIQCDNINYLYFLARAFFAMTAFVEAPSGEKYVGSS